MIKINKGLADELGLDPEFLSSDEGIQILAGNKIAEGSEPIAQAYAGHQFGHFVPQLGDGRAILLGEVLDRNGDRRDIQLKGSGLTRFSRGGDGRAALGPVIREYIVSEAMYALGIPTTRSLAAIQTGEPVYREAALSGAILTRVASSHIRVGTFEYFAVRKDDNALEVLTNHVLERHYPGSKLDDNPAINLLKNLSKRQSYLIAKWMSVGFIHGVMNTDNMSISGETIDYGPCAFMDFYDPKTVFSSIDHHGRYAYQNQAPIAQWNLSCLASALAPLIDSDKDKVVKIVNEILDAFQVDFNKHYQKLMLEKIGINEEKAGDQELAYELLGLMHKGKADFTLSFYYLAEMLDDSDKEKDFIELFDTGEDALKDWIQRWKKRLGENIEKSSKLMQAVNPVYIPRNHKLEETIAKAYEDDFSYMEDLIKLLKTPYQEQEGFEDYMKAPEDKSASYKTFCGT